MQVAATTTSMRPPCTCALCSLLLCCSIPLLLRIPQCKDCGTTFPFTVSEQAFYKEKGFDNQPIRCLPCRRAKKDGAGGGGGRGGRGVSQKSTQRGSQRLAHCDDPARALPTLCSLSFSLSPVPFLFSLLRACAVVAAALRAALAASSAARRATVTGSSLCNQARSSSTQWVG